MEYFFVAAVLYLIIYLLYRSSKSSEAPEGKPIGVSYETKSIFNDLIYDLAYNTLKDIGCQPEISENGTITVGYQGLMFEYVAPKKEDSCLMRVWLPEVIDVDSESFEMEKISEVANYANSVYHGATIIISPAREDGERSIHIRYDITLRAENPDNQQYLQHVMDACIISRNGFMGMVGEALSTKKQGGHRCKVVGFAGSRPIVEKENEDSLFSSQQTENNKSE